MHIKGLERLTMLLSRYSAGTMAGSEISLRTGSNEISVGFMPQQALVRRPEDDWTGTIDRERRRHRQNRLNQRAYREYYSLWVRVCMFRVDY